MLRASITVVLATSLLVAGCGGGSGKPDTAAQPPEPTVPVPATPDTLAPNAPQALSARSSTSDSISLGWLASADNIGVIGYEVWRNGVRLQATPGTQTTFRDEGLAPGTEHTYTVRALDAAGNASAFSASLVTRTLASTGPVDTAPPSAPAALAASDISGTALTLNWAASTDNVGIARYEVYRNGDVMVGSTMQTSFALTGLTAGTAYALTVKAFDAAGNASAASAALSVSTAEAPVTPTPDTTAPSVPAGVAVSQTTSSSLTLNWAPSTDAVGVTGYKVLRNGTVVGNTPTPGFLLTGLSASTAYSLSVQAFDAAGNTSASSAAISATTASDTPPADTAPPTVPTGLLASNATSSSLTISWAASTDNVGVVGYDVYRGSTLVGSPAATSITLTGLTAATSYAITVKAVDAANNKSAASAVLNASTATAPDTLAPSTPSGLTLTASTSTSLSISWTASTDNVGVVGYKVFNGSTQVGATVTATTAVVSGLTAGTTYSLKVQALDAAGNTSASSAALSAATSATGPVVVTLPIAEQPFGSLQLVDEIDTATVAPSQQIQAATSTVQTVLGRSARTVAPGDTARFVTYRLGAGKGLVAKQAYVLDIEYPDDVARAIFVANRGADFVRGFATGTAIGDVRRTYTTSTLESIAYPQTGTWKNYRSLFYLHERFSPLVAQRNAECANRSLLPADGFDVTVFQASNLNDPRSNGLAVGKIRLYKVADAASLPAAINYPASLARRHVYWREEMADEAVMGSTAAKRAVAAPIDWFVFKMDMGRALGFNTVGKDMMEWGFNQGFDSRDAVWMYNAQGPMTDIWSQIVAQAAQRNLYLLPYLEYGGSLGSNCASGQACDKTAGNYKSLGFQRRTEKLFHGVYAGNGETDKNNYTDVWWTEDKSADLTDPDTLTDMLRVTDRLLVQYKGQANFMGVWLRMRQTKLPMSFSAATLARYNADNPSNTRTLTQLRSDEASRASYYTWWYGKRRAFLLGIRDYVRTQLGDNSLQVHFSAYADEPVPRAYNPSPTETSSPLNLVSDDPTWWTNYANGLPSTGDNGWFKWQWGAKTPATSLSDRVHRNGLNLFKRPYNNWASNWPEFGHSTPPADPSRYQADDGLAMTLQFGNGLYTVDDAALLGEYANRAGASLVHHFPLNEDDGNGFENNSCNTLRPISLSDAFNAKFGYLSVAVEREGPYSVIAEARALANGNPINIGYLESSSMSRGFPGYVRRFNQALLSLPAMPLTTATGMSDDAQVVVRKTASTVNGTYYAVINPALQARTQVNITFPAASVKDLLTQTTHTSATLRMDLYPGEVRTFLVP